MKCSEFKKRFYTQNELKKIQKKAIPHHVAIIMDGNRRWAKKNIFKNLFSSKEEGHWAGAKVLVDIVEAAQEMGIKVLTVYAFSTENWSRPRSEIDLLFRIFEAYLKDNLQKMINNKVKFDVIGDINPLPTPLKNLIEQAKDATKKGNKIDFVVAMNYGGRDEIRRAIIKITEKCAQKKISSSDITEEVINKHLDTFCWRDPDLLIRTSGEKRISNFLLWQLAYAEIYVTDVLWPDFNPQDLLKAVKNFQKRQRRLGT